ncbi:MAG: carbon monoxide dehydrogenase subunit G [Nakamurella sp.]
MKIAGTSVLHATPEKVWAAITDPAVLAGVIPGCQDLKPLAPNHFGLTVSMGVAAIRGTYAGEVSLYDMTEPTQLTMRAAGAGGPGTIDTTVGVSLADQGDGTTLLSYDATATVGGAAGGVGQRVLTSVAKKTAGLFFSAIDDVLTGKKPIGSGAPTVGGHAAAPAAAFGEGPGATPAAPLAMAGAAPAFGASLAPAASAGGGGLFAGASSLVAVLIGAAAALIGVLVGAKIARRR